MTDVSRPTPPASETPQEDGATRSCPICRKDVPVAGGEWARHHAACWPLSMTSARPRLSEPRKPTSAGWHIGPLFVVAATGVGAAAGWRQGAESPSAPPATVVEVPQAAPAAPVVDPETRAAVDGLIAHLADADPEVRMEAARALGAVPSDGARSAPHLVTCLRDEPRVRAAASTALGALGEPAVAPLLAWLAEESDGRAALAGIEALGEIGPAAGTRVVAALSGPGRLRSRALAALGRIGRAWPQAVPHLLEALRDPNAEARMAAVSALGEVGPNAREAVPTLAALLDGQDEGLRVGAAMALAEIGRGGEASTLPHLVRILRDRTLNGSPWHEARPAAEALVDADPRGALPWLVPALAGPDPPGRQVAASLLARTGPSGAESVPHLIDRLADESADVRCEVARALGALGDNRATTALARSLREDSATVVRVAAAEALGRLGAPDDAREALDQAREDPSVEVARTARAALDRHPSRPR